MLAVDLVVTAGLTARPGASEDSLVQTEAGIEDTGPVLSIAPLPPLTHSFAYTATALFCYQSLTSLPKPVPVLTSHNILPKPS